MHQDNLIDFLLLLLENGDPRSENYLESAELLCEVVVNCH